MKDMTYLKLMRVEHFVNFIFGEHVFNLDELRLRVEHHVQQCLGLHML